MLPVAVGIDVGSSKAKALAMDQSGRIVSIAAATYAGHGARPPGRAVPQSLLAGVAAAYHEVMELAPGSPRAEALCIGGQSPTTVDHQGRLAVTVSDPAGAEGSPEEQHAAQHIVLQEALADDVEPRQLWDWVLGELGGAVDTQGRWPGDPPLEGYGDVVSTGTVVGAADGSHGIPSGTSLVPGAQDAYLAFWAAGVDRPGRGLDPGGRTGGLGVAIDAGQRPSGLYALAAAVEGVDIVGGPVTGHGLLLDWWAHMTGRTIPELLELAGAVAPGAGGVMALPYLEGERAPRWNMELRAELVGLCASSGPGEVTRALLESTALGLAHIARELHDQDVTLETLVCGGTPAKSRLWCSIKAAVLGVPVEVPDHTELAAFGAALAAGAGAGWWPRPPAPQAGGWPKPPCTTLEPEPFPDREHALSRFVALGDAAEHRLMDKEMS